MDNGNGPVTKADLDAALAAAVNGIKSYVDERTPGSEEGIKAYVREQVYEVQTKLLRGFADCSVNSSIRFQKLGY